MVAVPEGIQRWEDSREFSVVVGLFGKNRKILTEQFEKKS